MLTCATVDRVRSGSRSSLKRSPESRKVQTRSDARVWVEGEGHSSSNLGWEVPWRLRLAPGNLIDSASRGGIKRVNVILDFGYRVWFKASLLVFRVYSCRPEPRPRAAIRTLFLFFLP